MDALRIDTDGPVAILTMGSGENRIGSAAVAALNDAFDALERDEIVSSVVITGEDRYWSTGLDLDEMRGMGDSEQRTFMRSVDLLLGRILTSPLVTVAALNGHTYAAGALLALAHDYRIMRADRGFFCLPSVDVGIPFSPGMSALIAAKLPQPIAHDLVVSCRRIGGAEAAQTGVVYRAIGEANVLHVARELAHAYSGKDGSTLHAVKRRMYPEAAAMLTVD